MVAEIVSHGTKWVKTLIDSKGNGSRRRNRTYINRIKAGGSTIELARNMVSATGFEPATTCAQGKHSPKLSYALSNWRSREESNPGHPTYKDGALPSELQEQFKTAEPPFLKAILLECSAKLIRLRWLLKGSVATVLQSTFWSIAQRMRINICAYFPGADYGFAMPPADGGSDGISLLLPSGAQCRLIA